MSTATSIAELILKKWGAPAAGVAAAGQSDDSEAGPMTAAAKALLDRGFTESAVKSATDMAAAYKSREALTTMNIDEFLNLANPGFAPEKAEGLIGVDKFDEVPFLSMRNDDNGGAWITGHEGRHRAMELRSRGETEMPVRIRSNIRWDQQDSPDNFDYVEEWPSTLVSEDGKVTSPFPFARGDSNLLSSDGMALSSKYTPPKKVEPKSDTYDTELLAELLDEFNLEKGNADPRLLAGIAGTTAAGLAAPMIKDSGMISAPRSETLFDLTMGARDIERRLEGSPASLLFPSGLVEYLETVNRREEDPNAMTRGMALLDLF